MLDSARGSRRPPPLFHRIFIANRGEVAARIARACDALGITPVFAVSTADRGAAYTEGRETVCIGPARSSHSYLDARSLVQAAVQSRCTAVHPGWGFLSENPAFAALCEAHGVTFIGPPPPVMHLMGKKTPAKQAMRAAGLTMIPGSDGILRDLEHAQAVADQIGYPVLLKAESGGGGRGMRIARSASEVAQAYNDAGQRRAPPSATTASTSSASSKAAATSRSRSSPTATAASFTSASATAPSSATIRS
jgi:acetyl-CoA carboxylase biotin carboxylase subunit